ncbi:hypothetical protein, partial [Legionella pneumophila]
KPMDNKKTLPTAIVHTHRLLAHISTRLNSYYFLTATKPLKSNTYFEATTLYFFYPSATPFIEAIGVNSSFSYVQDLQKPPRS